MDKKKLKIGDKLAVYSADLYGCPKDGCPPLEAPEDLFLKLSVNSTRKAKWFVKLGFLKSQRPMSISLNSIKPNSNIGALKVFVERIYPMQFFETKPDGSKICRNQKQEEMFIYKTQIEYENYNFNKCNDEIDYDSNKVKIQQVVHQSKQITKRDVRQILKIRLKDALAKTKTSKANGKNCRHLFQ